jgi:hypothetical protein
MGEVATEHPSSFVNINVIDVGGNSLLESYQVDVQDTLAEVERLLKLMCLAEHGKLAEVCLICGCQRLATNMTIGSLGLCDSVVLTSVTCGSAELDLPGRIHAAETLMKSNLAEVHKRGRAAFLMTLQDPDATVRRIAALALGKHENQEFAVEIVPELVMLLRDSSPAVCQAVVNSLGAIKGLAISTISAFLCDKDWMVRGWASIALVSIGDAVVSEVEQMTSHRSSDVRRRALRILRDLDEKRKS